MDMLMDGLPNATTITILHHSHHRAQTLSSAAYTPSSSSYSQS